MIPIRRSRRRGRQGLPITNLHGLDFAGLDALVLSPGVPLTHPEPHWTVLKARDAGIEVIGDTEVFAREAAGGGCAHRRRSPAPTASRPPRRSSAMCCKQAGLDVDVGGNIGTAVFLLRQPVKDRIYVLELSSFQIDLMPGLAPDVGILTNLTPDHLDRHGNMENYAAVKARMFAKQWARATRRCAASMTNGARRLPTRRDATGADVRAVSVVEGLGGWHFRP